MSDAVLKKALKNLLNFVTSGRRYESRNPYSIPEVRAGFEALGLTPHGEPWTAENRKLWAEFGQSKHRIARRR